MATAADGFAAANARVAAVGDCKARRLAVAERMLGTDIVGVVWRLGGGMTGREGL